MGWEPIVAPSSRLTHCLQQEPTPLLGRIQVSSIPAAISRAGLQLGSTLALGSWNLLNMPHAAVVAGACVLWPWMGAQGKKYFEETELERNEYNQKCTAGFALCPGIRAVAVLLAG